MKKNWMFWTAISFLIVGIAMFIIFLYIGFSKGLFNNIYFIEDQLRNHLGSFFSGTVGIFFTLTATFFLFITFKEQRKQFELSKVSQDQSSFETTYFNLLTMLYEVRENTNKNIKEHFNQNDVTNIHAYYNLMKHYYKNYLDSTENNFHNNFKEIMECLNMDSLPTEKEQAEGCLSDFFESFINTKKFNLDYYFRYIYNTIIFVINEIEEIDSKSKESDIHRYLNILQAQLSNEELSLIFYNALSSYGKNKHGEKYFHTILDKYQFLENINVDFLLNRNHNILYPKTIFKFLNRDEKISKQKLKGKHINE